MSSTRGDSGAGSRWTDRERREGVAVTRGILIGLGASAVFWTAAVVGLIVLL